MEYAAPLLRADGVLVAWKGARDAAEEAAGAAAAEKVGMAVKEVLSVQPYPASENRHLHVFRKIAPTPDRVPPPRGDGAKAPAGVALRRPRGWVGRFMSPYGP